MTDNTLVASSDIANPDMQKFYNFNSNDTIALRNALKESSEVDLTLAQTSEKLANLENRLLCVLAMQKDVGTIYFEDDHISAELVEKLITLDLLTVVLNLELQELDNLTCDLQDTVVDCLLRLSVSGQSAEVLIELVRKLHDSEELIKQMQELILETKVQLAKMQMSSFSLKPNGWKSDIVAGVKEFQLSSAECKPQMQMVEQRRMVRMLEKSLTRELELEKKLVEFKRNEDDLKLKMRLTEQVAACLEVAAEGAWERFIEADNSAEVLMGISKEMLGKLQILQLNLSGSIKREDETKYKLQDCINQLNAKELSINNLNREVATLMSDNTEVTHLRQKAQVLEAKLNETETRLKEADSLNKASQQLMKKMECEIDSLNTAIYTSEIQVGGAEVKISHLMDSNLELTEELDFLRASNDDNSKKLGLVEEQLREYDIQLQHAKASSEASQEQQTMLYTAIWDMETLIDELKQKVANGESRIENKEAQCAELSKTISELNKELGCLRSQVEVMETSLMQSTVDKKSIANDISIKTNFIMDTIMQIAMERECIQKQLISLTMENKFLRSNLQKAEKHTHVSTKNCNIEEFLSSQLNCTDDASSITTATEASEISSVKFQLLDRNMMTVCVNQSDKPLEDSSTSSSTHQNEKGSIDSTNNFAGMAQNPKHESLAAAPNPRKMYAVMTGLFVLLSIIAAQLLPKKFAAPFMPFDG